jgi:hypothetical protein
MVALRDVTSGSSQEVAMTCIIDTKSKRLSAKLATGVAISAFLVLGTFVASASAQPHRDDHRRGDDRGWNQNGSGHGWAGGGYYAAPPVVYGGPAYYPPPVIYSPGIAIVVPGVVIGVQ